MMYVLGGDGFIGSHIVRALGANMLEHDLRQQAQGKFDHIHPGDMVFHAAHYGSIDECAKNPEGTRAINVSGTIDFLREMKKREVIPIYFSTNMVFDGAKPFYSEKEAPHPQTEYGKQKREVEEYIISAFDRFIIIRMTKVYGPGSRSFIDSWISDLREGKRIRAVQDTYAAPVYIDDGMNVITKLIEDSVSGICHMSGGVERTFNEIAHLIAEHVHVDQSRIEKISSDSMSLAEKRPLHNSLACDTVQTRGYAIPRDIPEILHYYS